MEFRYQYHGQEYTLQLEPTPDGAFTARIGGRAIRAEVERREGGQMALIVGGRRVTAYVASGGRGERFVAVLGREVSIFELTRAQGSARRAGAGSRTGELAAQMPGQVRQVFVAEGDRVAEGQPILLLEAMKMEIRVTAPMAGLVLRLLVKTGDTVERGQALGEVRPEQAP